MVHADTVTRLGRGRNPLGGFTSFVGQRIDGLGRWLAVQRTYNTILSLSPRERDDMGISLMELQDLVQRRDTAPRSFHKG